MAIYEFTRVIHQNLYVEVLEGETPSEILKLIPRDSWNDEIGEVEYRKLPPEELSEVDTEAILRK
jgi:hypothetical protein